MTREEKISHLKGILSEINENDNAVCYLTSEDNELIESAIEALEQEPCEDAISRKEALEALKQEEPLVWCDGADEIAAYNQWSSDVDTIKNIPSVQPQPKTGHWIDHSEEGYVECPLCGHATNCEDNIDELHYCFHCGARMIEPQESEETDADSN